MRRCLAPQHLVRCALRRPSPCGPPAHATRLKRRYHPDIENGFSAGRQHLSQSFPLRERHQPKPQPEVQRLPEAEHVTPVPMCTVTTLMRSLSFCAMSLARYSGLGIIVDLAIRKIFVIRELFE